MADELDVLLDRSQLDEFSWHRGFFPTDGTLKTWRRNFAELELRDTAVFALGLPLTGKSVLDLGCGAGMYALTFKKLGAAHVAGQDLSEALVTDARRVFKGQGFDADFQSGTCTTLKFADASFDCVFSGDLVAYLTEEEKGAMLREVFRVLKPGGVLVIKTPNLAYLSVSLFLKRLTGILMFQSPFSIHIPHTRGNPDSDHVGLTTHARLASCMTEARFHAPTAYLGPLRRRGLPDLVSRLLGRFEVFNEHVILSTRKPVFLGLY